LPLSNNLTKSLGFNAYQLFHMETEDAKQNCMQELNRRYSADFLIGLLENSAELIEAQVLNVSTELYKPHGTSVTMLVAEQRNTILGHLDKSHLTVHTYTDLQADHPICSFRLDFDLASCGSVTPLTTLPLLFDQIVCHLATIDYRVRGYSTEGDRLIFNDQPIGSILDFIPGEQLSRYECCNSDLPEHNLYHSKLVLKEMKRENHFAESKQLGSVGEPQEVELNRVQEQMKQLFDGL